MTSTTNHTKETSMKTTRIAALALVGLGVVGSACATEAEPTTTLREEQVAVAEPIHAPDCGAEDVLPMALSVDAYGYEAGTQVCVHVDVLLDQVGDRCYEDEPCFDCATMGNRICGTDR